MHPGAAAATNTVDSMLRHRISRRGRPHCEIRALLALLAEAVNAAAAGVCSAVLVRVNVPH